MLCTTRPLCASAYSLPERFIYKSIISTCYAYFILHYPNFRIDTGHWRTIHSVSHRQTRFIHKSYISTSYNRFILHYPNVPWSAGMKVLACRAFPYQLVTREYLIILARNVHFILHYPNVLNSWKPCLCNSILHQNEALYTSNISRVYKHFILHYPNIKE